MDTNKPSADLRVLRGKSGVIFRAIMNAIIPRGGAFGPGAADYDLLPRADEILRSYDPAVRKLFPLILMYVQYGAILRKGRTFTSLSERKGMEFLGSMERSPFFYRRMTILVLKLLTMLVFYESDETARLTGYEHGWCSQKQGQPS
jgi:hypothetical protein